MYNQCMSYVLQAVSDKPRGLWLLDSNTIQDYSGHSLPAAFAPNPTRMVGLVSGATSSAVLNASTTANFSSDVFKVGQESRPFTISVVFRVVESNGQQQVLGHNGLYDGIVVNGTVASFLTKYSDDSECRTSFDIQIGQVIHAVGVHTESKNILYINGELVDETDVTESQKLLQYKSNNGMLYAGQTALTGKIAVNAFSLYSTALKSSSVLNQYKSAINSVSEESVVSANGGSNLDLGYQRMEHFLQTWDSDADWNFGVSSNVIVKDGLLLPQFNSDTSNAGYWMDSFLFNTEQTSIYGVIPHWFGTGVTLEASLDGVDWEVMQRGKRLELIPSGFDQTNQNIQIRVSFAGGIVEDESYLESLTMVCLVSNVSSQVAGRTVTYTESNPLNVSGYLRDDWGVTIEEGGSISVSPDAAAASSKTVELWVKRLPGTTTPAITGFTSTSYVNGAPSAVTFNLGEWTLIHLTSATDIGAFTISGPIQIGEVSMYSEQKNATQVQSIYSQYMMTNKLRVDDNTIVSVTESITGTKIYAHEWTIEAAG